MQGTDEGCSDSLWLDSFTDKLKKRIDRHEEEAFKFALSDVATAKHPEIVKEYQVNGASDGCYSIDEKHLTVVETSDFLDISKEDVEENQVDNLFNQRGEKPDEEVHRKDIWAIM